MSKVIAAFLNHARPDLARTMLAQLPEAVLVNNGGGGPPSPREIVLDANYRFSGGWNRAMAVLVEHASAVWMLNDDVLRVSPTMLRVLAGKLKGKVAAVTPAFNSGFEFLRPEGKHTREVPMVEWTCPVVNARAWLDVGGFDEALDNFTDVDWCCRARRLGWRFLVHDNTVVKHLGRQTALALGGPDYLGAAGPACAYLCRKWCVRHWRDLLR